jgi:trimeric autotransporter adhesin
MSTSTLKSILQASALFVVAAFALLPSSPLGAIRADAPGGAATNRRTPTASTGATLSANPSALSAGTLGTVALTWSAPNSAAVQIYVNSATGTLFADGGSSGSQTTGDWVTAGMTFVLVDANTKTVLTSVTIQTVGSGGGSATITASPNPLPAGTDVVTLNWSAPNSSSVQVFVNSPGGQRRLFADGGSTGATATGHWASPGMTFHLVDAPTQADIASVTLTSAAVLAPTYVIHTIAGGAVPNGVPAAFLGIGQPHSVAVDAKGNVYAVVGDVVVRIDATTGLITTIAGNGGHGNTFYGYNGDNIPATSAELKSPQGVALDSQGNIYILDNLNVRIRKVSNGVITTIAGNGTQGYSGDNGPATSAQLGGQNSGSNAELAAAVDSLGNVYIADANNNVIRKVANGIITNFAGNGTPGYSGDNGPATSAQLSSPSGVAVDSQGNVYVADSVNNRIRKVSNGIITTFAGPGQFYPRSVAVDSQGNVYFADGFTSVVRKISSGTVTTFAGSGKPGYSGDGGPATAAEVNYPSGVAVDSQGNAYIADSENGVIRKVTNGTITTFAGNPGYTGDNGPATSAELGIARGVAVDSHGNVYFADGVRIRRVANGIITTLAGSGKAGYSGDNGPATSAELRDSWGIAVDPSGNVYIADPYSSVVRKVSNGIITTIAGNGTPGYSGDNGPATSAQLSNPLGIAVDPQGIVYVADHDNNAIRKVSNGIITTIAGSGTQGYGGDNGPATSAQLSIPFGVAVDPQGTVYIADSGNNVVRKVSDGVITTIAGNGLAGYSGDNGPATSAELFSPTDVVVDSQGNIYSTDFFNFVVRKVSNGIITTIAGNGQSGYNGDNLEATSAELSVPSGITADLQGNLYFSDYNRIRILLPQGGLQTGASLSASPDFLAPNPGLVTMDWTAPTPATELHVNSPAGTLFAAGGSSGSAATGDWATAGMTFYLLDSGTKLVLGERTILSDTATLAASPGLLPHGSPYAVTLTWNAPASLGVEIHVGSPTGQLFATGAPSGSATTGNWATAGMSFYLVDSNTHNFLASTVIAGN